MWETGKPNRSIKSKHWIKTRFSLTFFHFFSLQNSVNHSQIYKLKNRYSLSIWRKQHFIQAHTHTHHVYNWAYTNEMPSETSEDRCDDTTWELGVYKYGIESANKKVYGTERKREKARSRTICHNHNQHMQDSSNDESLIKSFSSFANALPSRHFISMI